MITESLVRENCFREIFENANLRKLRLLNFGSIRYLVNYLTHLPVGLGRRLPTSFSHATGQLPQGLKRAAIFEYFNENKKIVILINCIYNELCCILCGLV